MRDEEKKVSEREREREREKERRQQLKLVKTGFELDHPKVLTRRVERSLALGHRHSCRADAKDLDANL